MAKHPFVSDRDAFEALGERTVRMLGSYLRALPAETLSRHPRPPERALWGIPAALR